MKGLMMDTPLMIGSIMDHAERNFPNQEIKIPNVIMIGNVMAALAAFSGFYLTFKQTKSSKQMRAEEKSTYCKTELLDEQGLSDYLKSSGEDDSGTG